MGDAAPGDGSFPRTLLFGLNLLFYKKSIQNGKNGTKPPAATFCTGAPRYGIIAFKGRRGLTLRAQVFFSERAGRRPAARPS